MADVDTGGTPNPFIPLLSQITRSVFLCSICRDKRLGWKVISRPRKFGSGVSKRALQAWKTRCAGRVSNGDKNTCHICDSLPASTETVHVQDPSFSARSRNPCRDYTLFNLDAKNDTVRSAFVDAFCQLACCNSIAVTEVLKDPLNHFPCPYHINHSRYAQNVARRFDDAAHDTNRGICVFFGRGCSGRKGRLKPLLVLDTPTLGSLEKFVLFDESVRGHSNGERHGADVMGKCCCPSCTWVVTEGRNGTMPTVSVESISSVVDRMVFRMVLFALKPTLVENNWTMIPSIGYERIASLAREVRQYCIVPTTHGERVRMLPFSRVSQCRRALLSLNFDQSSIASSGIDDRTLQKRIEIVLASNGLLLKKLSHKLRCYLSVSSVQQLLADMALSNHSLSSPSCPSVTELRKMLQDVGAYFLAQKDRYWRGEWSLSSEISAMPSPLWRYVVMLLVSDRRLRTWSLTAQSTGNNLTSLFPLSNAAEELPSPSIEDALNSPSSAYTGGDLLISVRAMKIIEQYVLSRTNGVGGPLTISLSIAGICEVGPSFVSVLNAMGMFLSYSRTENYRQQLIAERERPGPWDCSVIDPVAIPTFQFDNWDIKPLHAVKVDNKAMPKVNGSLLQGESRKERDFLRLIQNWKRSGSEYPIGEKQLYSELGISSQTALIARITMQYCSSSMISCLVLCVHIETNFWVDKRRLVQSTILVLETHSNLDWEACL